MGILRAMAIRRRVRKCRNTPACFPLPRRSFGIGEIFWHGICPCCKKMPPAICRVAVRAFTGTHGGAAETGIFLYGSGCRFDQIWIEHADKLYESSGLKQEDMEYIYNLGQTDRISGCTGTGRGTGIAAGRSGTAYSGVGGRGKRSYAIGACGGKCRRCVIDYNLDLADAGEWK